MIRVILVDDHPVISKGIVTVLESSKEYQVVAHVESGEKLLDIINNTICEVIISDISMPGISGLQLLKRIKSDFPHIKFILFTMHKDRKFIQDAVKLDVDGYLLKEDPPELLFTILESVLKDYKTFSPKVQTLLVNNLSDDNSPLELLTVRERQIFDLVTEGMLHKEIADDLAISISTVEFHKKNIKSKLNARNITDLLNIAYKYKEKKLQ